MRSEKKNMGLFWIGLMLAVLSALMGITGYGSIIVSVVVFVLGLILIGKSNAVKK